jgi:putative ABC transport system permease protein
MFFLRLLYHSFRRQPRRKLLAGVAVTLSVVMATAMITIANDVEDRMGRELRGVGANIVVRPAAETLDLSIPGTTLRANPTDAYLSDADIIKTKQHFWSHNILGVTPILNGAVNVNGVEVPVIGTWFSHELKLNNETFVTGTSKTHKWWRVEGRWPAEDSDEVLLGKRLAQKLNVQVGQTISCTGETLPIVGVLSTGSKEDDAIVTSLPSAQRLLHLPERVSLIQVSALTKPEDDFARRDPKSMPPPVLERWMCSPYANSIAFTINQAVPGGQAEVVRAVAQNEGVVLSRISGLMLLIALCALLAGAVAVSASMATSLFERQREVGLLRSLGATRALIGTLFTLEAALLALIAGGVGFVGGSWLARVVSSRIFGSPISWNPALLPLVVVVAAIVTFAGSLFAIRRSLRVQPSTVLRGEGA